MRSKRNTSGKDGFTLVEVILAVGVIAMAIMALIGLLGTTFQQVQDVVETNQAIGVVTKVNAALDNPRTVGGEKIPNAETTTAFDAVYDFVKNAHGTNPVVLYYFQKEINFDNLGKETSIPVMYRAASDNFTQVLYNQQGGTGSVFRVEIRISNLLENQRIFVDTSTYEPTDATYVAGSSLPDVNSYALAYLPLEVRVFPHDFSDNSLNASRDIRPILTQNIVINR